MGRDHNKLNEQARELGELRAEHDRLTALVRQAEQFLRNGSGHREAIAGWLADAREALNPEGGDA